MDRDTRNDYFRRIKQRRVVRVSMMKLLFSRSFGREEGDMIPVIIEESLELPPLSSEDLESLELLTEDLWDHLEEVDGYIEKHLKGWSLHRLARADLAILEVAVYELLYADPIPHQVSINEALEISKEYSTADASKFINGILGSVYRDINEEE